MDELFNEMQDKGLINFEQRNCFGEVLQQTDKELNRQISIELAQTVPFKVALERTDFLKPTHFDIIPQKFSSNKELADGRN